MSTLVPIPVSRLAGADLKAPLIQCAAGDIFPAGGHIFLRVQNGAAQPIYIVANVTQPGPNGTSITGFQLAPTIPVGGDRMFGPFPSVPFADPTDGYVHVGYYGGGVTGCLVGVYALATT